MASFDTGVDTLIETLVDGMLDEVVAIARSHELDAMRSRFACGFAMAQMQRVIAWDQMLPDADDAHENAVAQEAEQMPEAILVDRFTRFEVGVKPRVRSLGDLGAGEALKDTGTGRSGAGSRTGTYRSRRSKGGRSSKGSPSRFGRYLHLRNERQVSTPCPPFLLLSTASQSHTFQSYTSFVPF